MKVPQTERSIMRTTQEPDALCFGCFREYLHALALASLDIIFFALFKLDRLGVDREVHMPIRRIEAFLMKKDRQTFIFQGAVPYCRQCNGDALTGRTIRSGFPCFAPPTPSPLAALRIISLACSRLALLSDPIWPSWITARLNGLNAGAGGRVDISATPLEVTDRASAESESRVRDSERPCQRSIYGAPDFLCEPSSTFGIGPMVRNVGAGMQPRRSHISHSRPT